jgi:hypothetical protein
LEDPLFLRLHENLQPDFSRPNTPPTPNHILATTDLSGVDHLLAGPQESVAPAAAHHCSKKRWHKKHQETIEFPLK